MKTDPSRKRISRILIGVFVLAMIMGPGPGLRLINPASGSAVDHYFVLGVPIIYAWGLFWYAVQLSVLILAYCLVWRHDLPMEFPDKPR